MGKLAHLLERENQTVRSVADQLKTLVDKDVEWKGMVAAVSEELEWLHTTIEELKEAVSSHWGHMEESKRCMAEMKAETDALRQLVTSSVTRSTQDIKTAVGGIKMPVIPAQAKTDLAPVLRALTAIQERQLQKVSEPTPPAPKKHEEWVFDIQRGPNGGITKVVAKEI